MYIEDLALNNIQRLIYQKPNQQMIGSYKSSMLIYIYRSHGISMSPASKKS